MSLNSVLFSRFAAYSGLTALVGNRIYWVRLPKGVTYPAITFQRISPTQRESAMGSDPGLARAYFQVTVWDDSDISVINIMEQVRATLQRWNTTGVQDIYLQGPWDLFDEEAEKFGQAMDAEVVYEEGVV